MSEVTLVKRILFAASAALLVLGAVGCTREKPPVNAPTPTGALALQVATPTSLPGSDVGAPTELPTLPLALPTDSGLLTGLPTSLPGPAATPGSPSNNPGTYTIQLGDWMNKIAQQFGVTYQAILAANPGLDPNKIYPGQVINIPSGGSAGPAVTPGAEAAPVSGRATTYTVQRGDWLYAIARKFGVSVASLQAANPGVNLNVVYPGQVLNIPGAAGSVPPTPNPSRSNRYTVQQGDTLFSIAVRFRTTQYSLQIANHLANANFIYPGQVLIIP